MRTKWSEGLVESKLRELIKTFGKFPTNSMLREIGMNSLSSQICRRGGFAAWAKRLGCSRADSDSDFGWGGELAVQAILEREGFSVARSSQVKAPYDLLVNGLVKIDVKTASFASYGFSKGWFYRIGKIPSSDLVCLFKADTGDMYLIPWDSCPHTNITITPTGKTYAAHLNAFDVLRKVVKMREEERTLWPTITTFHSNNQ
jgi:hypothetical protein